MGVNKLLETASQMRYMFVWVNHALNNMSLQNRLNCLYLHWNWFHCQTSSLFSLSFVIYWYISYFRPFVWNKQWAETAQNATKPERHHQNATTKTPPIYNFYFIASKHQHKIVKNIRKTLALVHLLNLLLFLVKIKL